MYISHAVYPLKGLSNEAIITHVRIDTDNKANENGLEELILLCEGISTVSDEP